MAQQFSAENRSRCQDLESSRPLPGHDWYHSRDGLNESLHFALNRKSLLSLRKRQVAKGLNTFLILKGLIISEREYCGLGA